MPDSVEVAEGFTRRCPWRRWEVPFTHLSEAQLRHLRTKFPLVRATGHFQRLHLTK